MPKIFNESVEFLGREIEMKEEKKESMLEVIIKKRYKIK